MISISLVMITLNDSKTLEFKLKTLENLIDEIIIVDLGSDDSTIEIAKKFTDNIYSYKWEYNFSDVKNFSFSKATCDYIFWLDKNELILKAEMQKLLELKKSLDKEIDVVYLDFEPRLLKRENNYIWFEPVNEYVIVWGKKMFCDISIFKIQRKKEEMFEDLAIYKDSENKNESFTEISSYLFNEKKKNKKT